MKKQLILAMAVTLVGETAWARKKPRGMQLISQTTAGTAGEDRIDVPTEVRGKGFWLRSDKDEVPLEETTIAADEAEQHYLSLRNPAGTVESFERSELTRDTFSTLRIRRHRPHLSFGNMFLRAKSDRLRLTAPINSIGYKYEFGHWSLFLEHLGVSYQDSYALDVRRSFTFQQYSAGMGYVGTIPQLMLFNGTPMHWGVKGGVSGIKSSLCFSDDFVSITGNTPWRPAVVVGAELRAALLANFWIFANPSLTAARFDFNELDVHENMLIQTVQFGGFYAF